MTGATGLVGSHVAHLLRSEGFAVRALHRAGSDVRFLRGLGCELVEGSLHDAPPTFDRYLEGCAGVVHAAAVVYSDLSWPRVREINVEGAERVFRAALRADVTRAVHLSSVAVYGECRGAVSEETPLDAPLRPGERYARSKRESERVVEKLADGAGPGIAILRPSVVYGERDRLFAPKIARILRLPVQPVLGDGRTTIPAVYAGNLAHAVLRCLRGPVGRGVRVYNVAEDEPITQRALHEGLARGLGTDVRSLPIPARIAEPVAAVADALGLRLPGAEETSLRRVVCLAARANPYRSERIREELGWSPPVPARDALRRTGEWLAGVGTGTGAGAGTMGSVTEAAEEPARARSAVEEEAIEEVRNGRG